MKKSLPLKVKIEKGCEVSDPIRHPNTTDDVQFDNKMDKDVTITFSKKENPFTDKEEITVAKKKSKVLTVDEHSFPANEPFHDFDYSLSGGDCGPKATAARIRIVRSTVTSPPIVISPGCVVHPGKTRCSVGEKIRFENRSHGKVVIRFDLRSPLSCGTSFPVPRNDAVWCEVIGPPGEYEFRAVCEGDPEENSLSRALLTVRSR